MYLSSHPLDRYFFEIKTFTNCKLADLPQRIDEDEKSETKEKIAIAGIVTEVKNVTTRSGSPGGRITLEDYSGPYEIALFGKDFEAYMAYMQLHSQLFIEGEVAERYTISKEEKAKGRKAPYSFRIKNVSLLGNVSSSKIKSLQISIDSSLLNEAFRKNLLRLIKAWPGTTTLKVWLNDAPTGYRVELHSKKFQVAVCADLLSGLERLGINYTAELSNG